MASPPGFNQSAGQIHSEVARDTDQSQLIVKKSWDVALGPVKGVIILPDPVEYNFNFMLLYFADPNESSDHVHGWKLDLNLPYHDGGNVTHQTSKSYFHHNSNF